MTFLELGTVLFIVGVLGMVGHTVVRDARKNAMRVRCRAALAQVQRMQILHAATEGGYAGRLADLEPLGLPATLDPVYSFELTASPARDAFRVTATANLDGDADLDAMAMDQSGHVEVLSED